MVSAIGGNTPQALMHDACRAISAGALDVVLVTGAEAMYARALSRRQPGARRCTWAELAAGRPGAGDVRSRQVRRQRTRDDRGVALPVHAYPLFENALRAANGWSLEEHAERIGTLWSRFSQVAAANPHAWIRIRAHARRRSSRPRRRTGWSRFPTRSCAPPTCRWTRVRGTSCARLTAAREAGVPEDRWVFPLAGADGNDHWFISNREELHRSPAIRLAGAGRARARGSRHRRRRTRRPLFVLPGGGADGGGASSGCAWTIRTGR